MKRWRRWTIIAGIPTALVTAAVCYLAQPDVRRNRPAAERADPDRLREHVLVLSQAFHPRDALHPDNLDRCAAYIAEGLRAAGARVEEHPFEVGGRPYRNVYGRFGPGGGPRIVVGAHYDTETLTPGADDNASGVAGVLELAAMLGRNPPPVTVELAAWPLEEGPYFATAEMGSAFHARKLRAEGVEVRGMLALEMIGYYADAPGSQAYPLRLLKLMYPSRGTFIGVVGGLKHRGLIRAVKRGMRGATDLPVYSISAPARVPGVDFSDHRSFWEAGYPAVMITDTAFYRNPYYHTTGDTADTLDYARMAKAVTAVYEAVRLLAGPGG